MLPAIYSFSFDLQNQVKEFINAIQSKIDSLDDGDVKGVLMWSEFKEFASMWKPKAKPIGQKKIM